MTNKSMAIKKRTGQQIDALVLDAEDMRQVTTTGMNSPKDAQNEGKPQTTRL